MANANKYPSRTLGEIELLSAHFGAVRCDYLDLTVVTVLHFDLPQGFNKRYSRLVIELGPDYPVYPPKDFYLSRGLLKNGKKPGHYYEYEYPGKKYCQEGYAWYCLHIEDWKPGALSIVSGDNLLTVAQAVYEALGSD